MQREEERKEGRKNERKKPEEMKRNGKNKL